MIVMVDKKRIFAVKYRKSRRRKYNVKSTQRNRLERTSKKRER